MAVTDFTCMEFEVVSFNPYEFRFKGIVPVTTCHEVGGYKPEENVTLWNWVDDVLRYLDSVTCYKKKQI